MLDLDSVIRHCEETAEREQLKGFEYNTNYNRDNEWGKKCYKHAEEYRQLAEWLKDYKRLLLEQDKKILAEGYYRGDYE